jgi:hypothetical protein
LVLATWTGVLVILILASLRSIPPVVLVTILPYLAAIGWHLLTAPVKIEAMREPLLDKSWSEPDCVSDPRDSTSPAPAFLEAEARSTESPATTPASSTEQRPSTMAPAQARRRARPRVVAVPSPASWVQVGPGRFVRNQEAEPSPDPSESNGSITIPSDASVEPPSVDTSALDEARPEMIASDDRAH